MDKIAFCCCNEPEFVQQIETSGRRGVVVTGIEAHACVQQTAIDLLALGYDYAVVADCVGSRSPGDRDIALRRVAQEGSRLGTMESLLFELCRSAGSETFKTISRLVK